MELRQLKYFVRIAELESMTKAADALFIAQPALSMQMRSLEEELGVQLFVRHSRGVRLTEAGQQFLQRATRIVGDVDAAKRLPLAAEGPQDRPVRVGINPSIAPELVARILTAAAETIAETTISIVEGASDHLSQWLRNGDLDIAIIYFAPEEADGIALDPLLRDDLMFFTHADGPRGETKTFDDVLSHPLILQPQSHKLRAVVEEAAATTGRTPFVPFEIQSVSIVLDLVERGFASSILPRSAIRRALAEGRVTASRIVEPELAFDLSLAYLDTRVRRGSEIRLQRLIREVVATSD